MTDPRLALLLGRGLDWVVAVMGNAFGRPGEEGIIRVAL